MGSDPRGPTPSSGPPLELPQPAPQGVLIDALYGTTFLAGS
jgi:hypothetical protein